MSALRRFMALVVMSAVATAGACKSGEKSDEGSKEGSMAVEGFNATRASITNAQTRVDNVSKALDQIASGADLPKSYAHFNTTVADIEKAASDAKKRGEAMRARMQEYVSRWQNEIDKMEDPTIRAGLTERREAVRQNFDKVRSAGQEARAAYDPYLKQLHEIQRALKIDLTPQQVTALKPVFAESRKNGETLKQKLSAMQAELDNISGGMASRPPTTKPAGAKAS